MAPKLDAKALTQEIGGVPVWGWGAIIAGAALIASRLRSGGSSEDEPSDMWTPTYATQGAVIPLGQLTPLQGGTLGDSSGSTVAPITPEEWEARAVRILAATGMSSVMAQGIIQRYLNGSPLTRTEAAALDRVLQLAGIPPWQIPTLNVVDDPQPTPPLAAAPTTPPPPNPTVTPAPAPMSDRDRWMSTAAGIYNDARSVGTDIDALGRLFNDARFDQMSGMGIKSNDENLAPYVRWFYGQWLVSRGLHHLTK